MPTVEAMVAALVPLAVTMPHVLPLHRVTPSLAALVWMCALALRALVAIGASIFVVLYMPQTGLYDAVAHWCWHEALPLVAIHLGLSGHPLTHAALVLPGLALAGSLLWLVFGLVRAWLLLQAKLRRSVGDGPLGSTIIADHEIVVGVTALGRGRILVSDVALGTMDPAEVHASLAHELGHIHRGHRPVLLLALMLGAIGRLLPGTRAAERELRFSLERDADEYAVARTADPLALASAICKAATARSVVGATGLGGDGRVLLRLDYLEGKCQRGGRVLERFVRTLAAGSVVAVLALMVTLPSWALAVPSSDHSLTQAGPHCS